MPKKYVASKFAKSSTRRKKKSSLIISALVGAIFFLIAAVGLLLGLQLAKQSQDIRQKAAGDQNSVQFSFSSSRVDDTHLQVTVLFNSQGFQLAGLDVRGTLANANASDVSISNGNTLALDDVANSITQNSSAVNFRAVRFASLDPNAQTSTHGQDVPIFSFIIANPQNSQITISLDSGNSSVSVIGQSSVNVQYPSSQTFTLQTQSQIDQSKKTCGGNCATDPECQSGYQCYKGMCRRQPNLEDASCGITANQAQNRTCGSYCADSTECNSQFTCYYNQCRNPQNVKDTACNGPATPKPAVFVPSNSTTTTTTRRVKPSPTSTIPDNATITSIDGQPVVSPTPTDQPTQTDVPAFDNTPTLAPSFANSLINATPTPDLTASPTPSPVPDQSSGGSGLIGVVQKVLIVLVVVLIGVAGYLLYKRQKPVIPQQ